MDGTMQLAQISPAVVVGNPSNLNPLARAGKHRHGSGRWRRGPEEHAKGQK